MESIRQLVEVCEAAGNAAEIRLTVKAGGDVGYSAGQNWSYVLEIRPSFDEQRAQFLLGFVQDVRRRLRLESRLSNLFADSSQSPQCGFFLDGFGVGVDVSGSVSVFREAVEQFHTDGGEFARLPQLLQQRQDVRRGTRVVDSGYGAEQNPVSGSEKIVRSQ